MDHQHHFNQVYFPSTSKSKSAVLSILMTSRGLMAGSQDLLHKKFIHQEEFGNCSFYINQELVTLLEMFLMNNYYMKADITNTRVFVRGIKG